MVHFVFKYGTLVERHEEDREDTNGGSRSRLIYFDTVACETWMSSVSRSPGIRGAPHNGLGIGPTQVSDEIPYGGIDGGNVQVSGCGLSAPHTVGSPAGANRRGSRVAQ